MTHVDETLEAVSRANAYHVLALAFVKPMDWEIGLPQQFRELLAPPGSTLYGPASEAADALEAALADREATAVAHARLFLGPFEIQASPYASVYLEPDQRLMGKVSLEVARAYAEAGLGPSHGPAEAPDHITHELEFMYFLAFQEATTAETVWFERQQRFWRTHLGQWLPEFADTMIHADSHPFYGALARLLRTFSDSEAIRFSA